MTPKNYIKTYSHDLNQKLEQNLIRGDVERVMQVYAEHFSEEFIEWTALNYVNIAGMWGKLGSTEAYTMPQLIEMFKQKDK